MDRPRAAAFIFYAMLFVFYAMLFVAAGNDRARGVPGDAAIRASGAVRLLDVPLRAFLETGPRAARGEEHQRR